MRRRSHWGWGFEDERPPAAELRAAAAGLAAHLGFGSPEPEQAVALEAIELPPARVGLPPRLPVTQDSYARALHAQGRSYLDLVRGFRGHFPHPPDAVALPRDDEELLAVLAWAAEADLAVVPVGGGTSVVGGIDARPGTHAGVVSLSLRAMNHVLEVDPVSRAARIQAGVRRDPGRRRHDHPSPRRRARAPRVVRPPAPGPVRRRAARRQGRSRPHRDAQPGRARGLLSYPQLE
jgi:alkyldihydroxyacetonephosphate synthase